MDLVFFSKIFDFFSSFIFLNSTKCCFLEYVKFLYNFMFTFHSLPPLPPFMWSSARTQMLSLGRCFSGDGIWLLGRLHRLQLPSSCPWVCHMVKLLMGYLGCLVILDVVFCQATFHCEHLHRKNLKTKGKETLLDGGDFFLLIYTYIYMYTCINL